jgi:hypothetical protein
LNFPSEYAVYLAQSLPRVLCPCGYIIMSPVGSFNIHKELFTTRPTTIQLQTMSF